MRKTERTVKGWKEIHKAHTSAGNTMNMLKFWSPTGLQSQNVRKFAVLIHQIKNHWFPSGICVFSRFFQLFIKIDEICSDLSIH